ncbi:phage tail tape measure protein [Latilactobacillus sakei subsp. sakei]|uniref:phage tail tape measure protein n=1 Tax=Latilactobacillus sakei TaxID=1599 RepID=UPI00285524D1|nr:phage tail tape measure protein [Latilactobacillus sakei]MDR7924381.1 phage tail tape measure protein [Latilactobacillus sakei subsp. sakei]
MAGEPLGQMIIELGLDSSSFGKGLDGAKKATRYAMAEMKSNMAVMGQAGNKYEALKAKQAGLTKVIESQTKEVIALKKAYDGSLVNGQPTAQTAKLATQLQNANGKLGSFNTQLVNNAKSMAMVKVETTGMTGAINNVGQAMTSSGAKLSSVGGSMTRNFTAPIVAGMGYATKSAIDFDSQISQMGPLLTNGGKVTAQFKRELDAMAESSKKWSKQYGVSTTEINNGMSELIKRGFTSQQVMGSMPSILDATKASGEEMGVVMQATASIVEQFGLKTNSTAGTMKNTQRVTDSLTYAANATAAGFGDMSEAMSYVGPVASSLGLSVEQTAAAVGELSNQGIEGQKAGTNLRGILTSLIKPTKQNTAGFESMGISAKQLAHDSHDLPQLIDDITKGTAGWKNAERGKALAQAFGRENQAAANALVKAGSSSLRELTTETQNATGATKKVADQMNGTKANQIKKFQESLHVLAIETGEKLLPTLMPIVEDATKMVDAFGKLDSATQQNILRTGLWIAAAGPISKVAGSGLKSIGALATGYVDLSAKIEAFAAGKIAKRELGLAATATESLAATTTKSAGTMTRDMVNWSNNLGKNTVQAKTAFSGLGESMGATAGKAGIMSAVMSPLGLTVIGVTAAVGLGITAWELWGKQAYASMESTAKWGTNVSGEADRSLTKMQGFSTGVSNALDGFANKSDSTTKAVASSFNGMYKQLESDSKKSFKQMQNDIDNLPAFAKSSAEKDLAEKKKTNAKIIADAKSQNTTVQSILKQHNGDVSALSDDEKQIVLNARTRINADELKLLQIGGKAKKVVLETLNGDVAQLSRQRRDQEVLTLSSQYTKEKKIYESQSASIKKAYKDGAISADTYKKSMKELESSHKSSVDNMAAATLKLDRANGKSKDEIMQDLGVYETSYKRAAAIVDGQSKKMSKSTSLIAADTNSMSKETAKANQQWNSLVFDPKTGKVKTNAKEEVDKAVKSKTGWANLKYDLKHANLSSNAKLMIGEAALANGKWDDLTWKEQQAIIAVKGNKEMANIIQQFGIWDQFTPEQKEAILHGDASPIANLLLKGGQWNELSLKEQQALVKDKATVPLVNILEKYGVWQGLSDEEKNAILNTKGAPDLADMVIKYGTWNELPQKQKDLLINNADARQKLIEAGILLDSYKTNNPASKPLEAHDGGLSGAVTAGNAQIDGFKTNNPPSKPLKAHDAGLGIAVTDADGKLIGFRQNNPESKGLRGHDAGLGAAVTNSNASLDGFAQNNPSTKGLRAKDNASGPAGDASRAVDDFSRRKDHTITLTSIFETITKKIKGNARGTNHHPGGPMMVNDQQGGTFREMIQRPNGFSFIPMGRNVILPDEPIGTKVIPAARTNRLLGGIPQFANGTPDIPADAEILKNINRAQTALTNQTINISGPNNDAVIRNQEVQIKIQQSQLDILHTLLNTLTNQEPSSNLDLKQLAQMLNATNQQSKQIIKYNNG